MHRLILVSCFCSEFIESKKKKEEERFLGGVKWELWLGNSMLMFNKLTAKTRHQN